MSADPSGSAFLLWRGPPCAGRTKHHQRRHRRHRHGHEQQREPPVERDAAGRRIELYATEADTARQRVARHELTRDLTHQTVEAGRADGSADEETYQPPVTDA